MKDLFKSRQFWIGMAFSAICLWLALRNVPFKEFSSALEHANYWLILPAVLIQFAAVAGRAQRWSVLIGKPKLFWTAYWSHSIGFLFTNVLPLRMGEAARVVVMSERSATPVVQVAATAVIERALDVAFVVVAMMIVLPFMQVPPVVVKAGIILGGLALIAFIGLWLVVRFRSQGERVLAAVLARLAFLPARAIQARWGELVEGLTPLTRLDLAVKAIFWTVVSWIFSIGIYWFVMKAFLPGATLVEAIFVVVALALAISVPSSPGFIGVFQYVGQQALVLPFGGKYTDSNALAIVLTSYLVYYLITTGLGVVGLMVMGKSFANLGRMLVSRRTAEKPIQ